MTRQVGAGKFSKNAGKPKHTQPSCTWHAACSTPGMAPHASVLVQWGIGGIALAVVVLVGVGVWRIVGKKRGLAFAAVATTWLGATAALGYGGFFSDFESRPPHLVLLMLPTLLLPIVLALSSWGASLSRAPLTLLIGFQASAYSAATAAA